MLAVIGCWPLPRCRSSGCTHPNSAFGAPCEPHPNDGRTSKHGKYEQCEEPKDGGPMDKADRHTDTACSHNEAKPRESMAQMFSNRHGLTSCRLAPSVERLMPILAPIFRLRTLTR